MFFIVRLVDFIKFSGDNLIIVRGFQEANTRWA